MRATKTYEIIAGDTSLGAGVTSKAFGAAKRLATLPIEAAEYLLKKSPKPSKSWFIGHSEIMGTFVGDDEVALAREGGRSERMALQRRITSSGYNSHQAYIRGDSKPTDQQEARQILNAAVSAKSIARPELKRAIRLCAGPQSTKKEQLSMGAKVLSFLSKRGVQVAQ